MRAEIQNQIYDLAPDAVVAQVWGLTETGWVTCFDWREKDVSGSVGRLLPNVELKYVEWHSECQLWYQQLTS